MKKLIYILSIAAMMACSASEKAVVTNIQDLTQYPEGSSVYSLPRTRLVVDVQAVSTRIIPGPYARYAEEYLGIEGAPEEEQVHWEISDITLHSFQDPDPEYYFCLALENGRKALDVLHTLKEDGFVMTPEDLATINNPVTVQSRDISKVYFTDLSVKRFTDEEQEKPQKKPRTRVPVDMPAIRASDAGGTRQEKAQEAANFIIKIRKRRFKLLAGQYEVMPEGQALAISVSELNKLEEEYLSLFIGQSVRDTISRSFSFIPGSSVEIERKELCHFSVNSGFEKSGGDSGIPIVLDLRNLKYTSSFHHIVLPYHNPGYVNTLLYRIPDKALVKIFAGSMTVYEGEIPVSQYGVIVPLEIGKE